MYKYAVRVIQVKSAEKGKKPNPSSTVGMMYRHCHFVFILDTYLA